MDHPVEQQWEFRVAFDAYTDDMAREALTGLTEGVVRANMVWLNAHPEAPCCLADEGIVYVRPKGCGTSRPCQTVLGAAEIFRRGEATCIDIAAYMAAILRLRGIGAEVVFDNMLDGSGKPIAGMYHVLVRTEQGVIDYTQDLIDGEMAACSVDCERSPMSPQPFSTFDPSRYLPG